MLNFTERIAIDYMGFVPDQRTWMFVPADGGTTLDVELVNRGGARWERALGPPGAAKIISKQLFDRLARINTTIENQTTPVP